MTFTMRAGVTVTERQIGGGCIRLTVDEQHVAHVLRVRRKLEQLGLMPERKGR